jgi:hypothetical protein
LASRASIIEANDLVPDIDIEFYKVARHQNADRNFVINMKEIEWFGSNLTADSFRILREFALLDVNYIQAIISCCIGCHVLRRPRLWKGRATM